MSLAPNRQVLHLCISGALVMCTGCLERVGTTGRDASVKICNVTVINQDTTTHEIKLQFLQEGQTVHEESSELNAVEEDDLGGYTRQHTDSISIDSNDFNSSEGSDLLRVQIDNTGWHEFDLTTVESSPVSVVVPISGTDSISFLANADGNTDCDTSPDS
jgi:hypothetical protein